MRSEISGFIQKDHFDLNSYLTYLFSKFNEHPSKKKIVNKKFLRMRGGKGQSDCK